MYVYLCVCERASEIKRKRERERGGGRVAERRGKWRG